jgi:hypothetical protein
MSRTIRMKSAAGAILAALLALAGCGGSGGTSASGAPASSQPFVSAPDCAGPSSIVAEDAAAPQDATFVRVQHIGDPGTAELAGEVAHEVTWAVGDYTGFYPADAGAQRGFRDAALPDPASAFQLDCGSAGVFIDTWEFPHHAPLVGEGPSASVARDPSARPALLHAPGATFTIEADVDLHSVRYQQPHTGDGTAQLSFFYYAQDATTGTVIAHLIALFDSRAPGVNGSAMENVGSDGHVAFVSSPLAALQADGTAVRFASPGAGSATERNVDAWSAPVRFRAVVTYEEFAALLGELRAGPLPAISPRPEDWHLTEFGVLAEVFPGTGDQHNVALGASVLDLRLSGT